jgi:hypothetical protein
LTAKMSRKKEGDIPITSITPSRIQLESEISSLLLFCFYPKAHAVKVDSLGTFIDESQFNHQSNQASIFDFPTEFTFKHVIVTSISPFILLPGPILPGSLPFITCPAGGGKKDSSELTLRAGTHFCIASNSFNILNPSILTTSSIFFPCGPGGLPHKYMTRFLTSGE